ncbi:7562_t:CDS:2 [Gigaspora margarita]|uniref:7562_t:CDS:1 n=1 Tax=Gigaspora margarita TaxID=4874 RepID=A0ABN7W2S4_GIGMA|nr:7562_t:CDS:2 [Gigaspora margarita]
MFLVAILRRSEESRHEGSSTKHQRSEKSTQKISPTKHSQFRGKSLHEIQLPNAKKSEESPHKNSPKKTPKIQKKVQ